MRPESVEAANRLTAMMLDEIEELRRRPEKDRLAAKRRERLMLALSRLLARENVSHDPDKRKQKIARKIEKLKIKVKEVRKASKRRPSGGKKQFAKEEASRASKSGPWGSLVQTLGNRSIEHVDA